MSNQSGSFQIAAKHLSTKSASVNTAAIATKTQGEMATPAGSASINGVNAAIGNSVSTDGRETAQPGFRIRPDFFRSSPEMTARSRYRVRETLCRLEQPPIAIAFGRAVRKQRESHELSQQALASRAVVNPKHLSTIERGEHEPRLTTIDKLAGALDMSCGGLVVAADEERAVLAARADRQS